MSVRTEQPLSRITYELTATEVRRAIFDHVNEEHRVPHGEETKLEIRSDGSAMLTTDYPSAKLEPTQL